MWHAIVVDAAFEDSQIPGSYKKFAEKQDGAWTIVGLEIQDAEIESAIIKLQARLRKDAPFYIHFYNNEQLVVAFRERIFRVSPHASTWGPIIEYGATLAIPPEQLDFWPNRFQDERRYFI